MKYITLGAQKAETFIYLIAGVHGDEPEGVYVLEQLLSWLNTIEVTQQLIIIPVLNPDGLAAKTRVNANGVDLNRNFPTKDWAPDCKKPRYYPGPKPLSEPENIFLVDLFAKYKPELIISFHSWLALLDCNVKALPVARRIAAINNYSITTDIGYPTPGSLGRYVDQVLYCGIITFELPVVSVNLSMQQIWQQNEAALKRLFKIDEYK